MLRIERRGSASSAILWPLLALAAADPDKIEVIDDTSVSCPSEPFGTLVFESDDPMLTMRITDASGATVREATIEGWGHDGSEAYWWPFGWLGARANEENLRVAIERAQITLDRLAFYDREPIQDCSGRESAAVDYLRLVSGVTDSWTVALAAPHELFLDGDELVHHFAELPPGLADRGECALISEASGDVAEWWLRPVMCVFDNDLEDATIDEFRDRLVELGFTATEIAGLDEIAIELSSVEVED
jgi:hypothetical protein